LTLKIISHSALYEKTISSAAWPRGLNRRFYGGRVITIGWSRFNSHSRRTRCCVLG